MINKFKKVFALGVASCVLLTGCAGSGGNGKEQASGQTGEKTGDVQVIRIGSHDANGMNPNYKDPVTGEYGMTEEWREIRLAAEQKVKDELNVQIEWVQFPGETTEVLLQSVMAGDPLADVVNLYANSQGKILGQNILQPLDDYTEYFKGDVPAKIYGKHYFLTVSGNHSHPLSPLFYNIDYIEQVDALKENGKTVYPTDLYKQGKWTWSTFEDYLAKINAHYANSQAPERPEKRIDAYRTDYTETLIQALQSAGGGIYTANGLEVDAPATKEAVAYVQKLVDKKLLVCELVEGTSNRPYNAQGEPFEKGESVFTNIEDWRSSGAAAKMADRGQSIGFIPFPRPDHMSVDDPNYRQARTGGESWGILRGVDKEIIPLSIQTFETYMGEVDRLRAEIDGDQSKVALLNVDVFHPEIGTDLQEIYDESTANTIVNEFSNMTGVYWNFMEIAGDAIYGVGGSPSFDVAIEAKKATIQEKIDSIEAVLNTTEVKDNIAPKITAVETGKVYAFAKGTDAASLNLNADFTVEDNMDGVLDAANLAFDMSATDFNAVGAYKAGIVGTISDSNENVATVKLNTIVYDADNKTVPTLVLKEEARTLQKDEDASKVNWANDFVETATDKDGLDLKANVVADLSEIDTTTAGTYNVALTVTDYAGNETSQVATVVVE